MHDVVNKNATHISTLNPNRKLQCNREPLARTAARPADPRSGGIEINSIGFSTRFMISYGGLEVLTISHVI